MLNGFIQLLRSYLWGEGGPLKCKHMQTRREGGHFKRWHINVLIEKLVHKLLRKITGVLVFSKYLS